MGVNFILRQKKNYLFASIFIFLIFSSCSSSKKFTDDSGEDLFVRLAPIRIWENAEIYSKKYKVKMTAFLPAADNAKRIGVVIFPGGSYYYMDIKYEGYEVAEFLAERGIAGFVVDYRTAINANHHPAMIEDAQRVIQLVKENADSYNVDAKKIGVMGFSAGGHLAGTAAEYFTTNFLGELAIETKCDLKPAFSAMIYPVVTMHEPYVHKKSRRNLLGDDWKNEDLRNVMSLEKNIHSDMPPMFIVHCTGDKTVDFHNSLLMKDALAEKGVPHEFLLFDEEGHGFGVNPKKYPNNNAWTWGSAFVEWVDRTLSER